MWSLRKPTESQIQAVLAVQARLPFTYRGIGGTRDQQVPDGYRSVHYRTLLGSGIKGTGADTFAIACRGLQRWQQFPAEMVEIHPRGVLLEPGNAVGVLVRQFKVWILMAARIVYTIDEPGPIQRFGFAYGTLPSHLESGEERFLIEWDHRTDQVWYDLHMFCKPSKLLARIMDWHVRRVQRRFARLSVAAMQRVAAEQRGVSIES